LISLIQQYKSCRKIAANVKNDLKLAQALRKSDCEPVIVYQMGKVGSRSITDSLKNCGVDPVFHIHRMNPDNIKRVKDEYLKKGRKPLNERSGIILYKNVCRKKRKAKFITIVREPVSRNFSAFFQNFKRFTGSEFKESKLYTQKLIRIFISEYMHDVPLIWFDIEIKNTLGIDVYNFQFPKEKGHMVIQKNNFELLVLKLEIPDRKKQDAISEFMNLHDFRLIRANVGKDKDYSETYKKFKDKIQMPHSYLKTMLNSKYSRHFYTDLEINAIWSKWADNDKPRSNV